MKACFIIGDTASPEQINKILSDNSDQLIISLTNTDKKIQQAGVKWELTEDEWKNVNLEQWEKLMTESFVLNNMNVEDLDGLDYVIYDLNDAKLGAIVSETISKHRSVHSTIVHYA